MGGKSQSSDLDIEFVDTPGLRKTSDKIEGIGISRTGLEINAANSLICVLSCEHFEYNYQEKIFELVNYDYYKELFDAIDLQTRLNLHKSQNSKDSLQKIDGITFILNKVDLLDKKIENKGKGTFKIRSYEEESGLKKDIML